MKITTRNMGQYSAQQVFDYIVAHLRKQGVQSLRATGADGRPYLHPICAYRGGDNQELKCAAGCLIDDEDYKFEFENYNWVGMVEDFHLGTDHQHLINQMQLVHDFKHSKISHMDKLGTPVLVLWEIGFQAVASNRHLTYTAP